MNGFKWIENASQFNKCFIESCNEENVVQADVQYPEELHEFHSDLPLLPEKKINRESWKTLRQLAW